MAGGARPGAGRKKGVPNKATADVKAMARLYVPDALKELARLSLEAESEQARVSAIKEIMDRAYGKATTMIGGDVENPLQVITHIQLVAGDGDSAD